MKILFACFLTLSLFSSTTLASSSGAGIQQAIEELNYALTVEWDQKDMTFYRQQLQSFQRKVQQLPLAQESRKQLLLEALSQLPQSQYRQDVMNMVQQLNDSFITPKRMQEMLTELSAKSSAEGANWNGSGSLEAAVVVAIVVMIMVVIISTDEREEENHYTIPPWDADPIMDPEYPDFGCDVYPMCDKYRP